MRRRRLVVAGGVLASVLAVGQPVGIAGAAPVPAVRGQAPLTAAEARSLARNVTKRVIVVLRNQDSARPATAADEGSRAGALAVAQRPILTELARTGARRVHADQVVDAVSATVSAAEARRLAANPAVREVVPDEAIPVADGLTSATDAAATIGRPTAPLPGACAPRGRVQLDPQALQQINARSQVPGARTAASLGYTGAGVKVAYIAEGIDINNPEFIRPNGQHVFVDYQDFSGSGINSMTDGGEAFLDAGSIAAQGSRVYDVSHYSALPLSRPCDIRIVGVSPGASLVGLDAFGNEPYVTNSAFLEAIDWAVVRDHVNVLNESFGSNPFPDVASLDLTRLANDQAVAAGVTVSVSSGDAGITSTIGSPATDPLVISSGATTTYRLDAQDGYGGARFPGVRGWLNDNISSLSSGGTTEAGRTVDVVAPGELNWLPCSLDQKKYFGCANLLAKPTAVEATGGTSESAPITSGVAALVIQAYRSAHGGTTPSPAVVKQIVTSTAVPVDAPADQEGAGIDDAYQAVQAARSYGQTPAKASGSTLLTSISQFDVRAEPGTPTTLAETVTNNGRAAQTVAATTRAIGVFTPVRTAGVVLSDTGSQHVLDWQGITDNVDRVTFTVPAGKERLNASIAFQAASATDLAARVRMTLVDPLGRLAAYSLPQGPGNFGDAQVARPAPGRWTAYIYSRDSADGGTTGPVVFGASVANWVSYGTVTPASSTLAPGASGTFTVHAATPATPGDQAAALVLRSTSGGSRAASTSVPIIARSLIPAGTTSFAGVLTGGNGRSTFTGQTAYYQLTIPSGLPALNASITLADNPTNTFSAELVDPQGQAVALGTNATIATSAAGPTGVPSLGAELHVLAPAGGTWDLVIDFQGQVSGSALAEPYSVAVDETAVPASATGVPVATSTVLPAGRPVQASVTVHNSGTAPQAYFVDPRLDTTSVLPLTPLGSNVVTVPGTLPVTYVVPTQTTNLAWTASSGVNVLAELTYFWGDPDVDGNVAGHNASGSLSASPNAQGPYGVVPQEFGPDKPSGATHASVATSLTATTATFDPTITSSTGDLWLTSLDPANVVNLIVVQPGQSATIPVTITPSGAPGTVVTGTMYVDAANLVAFNQAYTPDADQVAAIPYRYTVGS